MRTIFRMEIMFAPCDDVEASGAWRKLKPHDLLAEFCRGRVLRNLKDQIAKMAALNMVPIGLDVSQVDYIHSPEHDAEITD